MTFHPEVLDLAQLKRLSKQMQRGSKDVLPNTPLTLTQSQELLARALGYPSWHGVREERKENKTKEVADTREDPFIDIGVRAMLWQDLQVLVDAAFNFPDAIERVAATYGAHGLDERARALKEDWIPAIRASEYWQQFVSRKLATYDKRAAIVFDLVATAVSAGEALRQLARAAEREGDRSDYSRLSRTTVVNNTSQPAGA